MCAFSRGRRLLALVVVVGLAKLLSPSIERTEAGFPFLIESYEVSADSGGAGRRRGGLGGEYRLRYEGTENALLNAAGDMIIGRYADDTVIGFEHEADARRFWDAMRERLREFSLPLHPDKTRLIEFGRHAA